LRWQVEFKDAFQECDVFLLFGDLLAQPGQFCPFRGSERLISDSSGVVDASSFVGDPPSEQVLA
jgi:hypothetical protein